MASSFALTSGNGILILLPFQWNILRGTSHWFFRYRCIVGKHNKRAPNICARFQIIILERVVSTTHYWVEQLGCGTIGLISSFLQHDSLQNFMTTTTRACPVYTIRQKISRVIDYYLLDWIERGTGLLDFLKFYQLW